MLNYKLKSFMATHKMMLQHKKKKTLNMPWLFPKMMAVFCSSCAEHETIQYHQNCLNQNKLVGQNPGSLLYFGLFLVNL